MQIKQPPGIASLFAVALLAAGLSVTILPGCGGDDPVSGQERDHVWPVDQNGVEVPVPGTWVLVAHTNANSTSTIGESFTLPPDPPHTAQASDGTYTDGDGIEWTKVRITSHEGDQWQFLERVDTGVSPPLLHVVVKTDTEGIPVLEYGEYPFDLPLHNVQIWEKQ